MTEDVIERCDVHRRVLAFGRCESCAWIERDSPKLLHSERRYEPTTVPHRRRWPGTAS
jgi:hypothetical protein